MGKWSSSHMVSPQPIYNLSSPFMLIVDKGGEKQKYEWKGSIWHRGRDMRYDKGKGSIKILSTQVGGASS